MTEPGRLVEEGTEFERSILASARLDVPRDDGLKRVLAAIGAGTLTISASASTAGAGMAAGGGAGAAAGGTLVGATGVSAVVKWIGIAVVVVGAGTAVTAESLGPRRSAEKDLRIHSVQATLAAPSASPASLPTGLMSARAPAIASTSLTPEVVEPRAAVAPKYRAPVQAAVSPPLASRSAYSLGAEVSTLDRVRASLAEHDAARALNEVDAYDRAFPNSVLAEEATVLRFDALVETGDRAAAEALGRRFLSMNPGSPHAAHFKQLLGAHNL